MTPVLVSEGFMRGLGKPFYVATAGRATLSTTLGEPAPDPLGTHLGRIVYAPPSTKLGKETVRIVNGSCLPIQMDGWTLSDRQGNVYTFGAFTLQGGAGVKVHTGMGTDSALYLYWGRSRQVWGNGSDTATLARPDGSAVDSCSYAGGGVSISC